MVGVGTGAGPRGIAGGGGAGGCGEGGAVLAPWQYGRWGSTCGRWLNRNRGLWQP